MLEIQREGYISIMPTETVEVKFKSLKRFPNGSKVGKISMQKSLSESFDIFTNIQVGSFTNADTDELVNGNLLSDEISNISMRFNSDEVSYFVRGCISFDDANYYTKSIFISTNTEISMSTAPILKDYNPYYISFKDNFEVYNIESLDILVEVSYNALDELPIWVDVTDIYIARGRYEFINMAHTNGCAISTRINIKKIKADGNFVLHQVKQIIT